MNSVWNGSECNCIDGYYFVNCKCMKCPSNRVWNSATRQCELPVVFCGPNEESNGYICNCKPGFSKKDGVCASQCPALSNYFNGSCVCFVGYSPINGQCLPNPTPPVNPTPPPTNPTQPPITTPPTTIPPTTPINPTTPTLYCSANAYWNGVSCVCNYGYSMSNGVCAPIVGQCQTNQYWNGNSCVCNIGFVIANGVCIPSTTTPTTCGTNMYWNGVVCVCKIGYQQIGGVCMTSTTGCYPPLVWNNGGCVCNPGFALIGTTCLPVSSNCPALAYWNGVTCVCQTGYCLTNGVCTPIPIIQCGANAYFNGVSCRCMTGYYKTPNNLCLKCPIGKYWNGRDCVKNNHGDGGNQCRGGRWNGNDCDDDDDLSCVANSFWDGIRCVCNRGYYNVSGYCITCPPNTYYNGWSCIPGNNSNNYCGSN